MLSHTIVHPRYDLAVNMEREAAKAVLSRNVRWLMADRKCTQERLAKRSGASQRTISNVLTQKKTPTLDTVDRLAKAYNVTIWELLSPFLPDDMGTGTKINKLLENYLKADDQGKALILQLAERETSR